MFDNFRQQYPQGSIISDLVQINGDQYVVRVSISSAGTTLVATLAADPNLMLAENRATERALAILGITAAPATLQPVVNSEVLELVSTEITPSAKESVSSSGANSQLDLEQPAIVPVVKNLTVQPLPELPAISTAASPVNAVIEAPFSEEFAPIPEPPVEISTDAVEFYDQSNFLTPGEEIDLLLGNGKIDSPTPALPETLIEISAPPMEPIVETAPVAKASRVKKATATPEPVPEQLAATVSEPAAALAPPEETIPLADPPLSVTDMIPLINMELKRLGWSKERGRDYMVSLYNKRASALLSDEELFGLLQHLKAEPIV
jgi:hypothetical protein